jgi:methylmalonyl-CoA mutase
MQVAEPYVAKNKIRIVTAASLFDGHDAAINIMRRIMQRSGAEIIHLGHNRSAQEIVDTAIQEDVQGIAITSYQGGHMEFFKYIYDLLQERGAGHIKVFGGGGGTILPTEIEELHAYGISRIYSPDDGRSMGLQGMINDLLGQCDFATGQNLNGELKSFKEKNKYSIARLISAAENDPEQADAWLDEVEKDAEAATTPILGITGTGGAGKSSLVDELVRRFLLDFEDKTIAVISVDPSKRKTGGALLGDRIRMNAINSDRVYMRSLATRQSNLSVSKHIGDAVTILKAAGYDLIILETSGIGQSDTAITDFSNVSLYVMTPEYGAATQLEKIDMLDFADLIALNKFDKRGALDALRDVRKQYKRNHNLWEAKDEELPVFGTIASQFNDPGMNSLYKSIMDKIVERTGADLNSTYEVSDEMSEKVYIIPPSRVRYLSEITDTIRRYNDHVKDQANLASELYQLEGSIELMKAQNLDATELQKLYDFKYANLDGEYQRLLEGWSAKVQQYKEDEFVYQVRQREIRVETFTESLSHSKIPKIATPKYKDWGDVLEWSAQEGFPGEFPYTAGVFPFKRKGEDPTRMFAGEGNPERTNRRFHYVSLGMPAARLSTAFDSVTLYGEDPDYRPDIYGKIGNSGVSVCCLDDAKKLYSGFDLCDPKTSVSMTINGPAATIAAFFMNAAIDQQCEKYIKEQEMEDEVNRKIVEIFFSRWLGRFNGAADNQSKWDGNSFKTDFTVPFPAESYGNYDMKAQTPADYNQDMTLVDWRGLQVPQFIVDMIPAYLGELPEGNDGLGLMLLGVTGDEVLDAAVYAELKKKALTSVRGTVQADILKEDQAQNTCIFSTEFSLRVMGDVQQYFIDQAVRNFYSVSISGYHIAEAGANPITQLAFTLANGFTFVEYYLSRGMDINAFAPNLSFFFSNGIDPEYAVIGRVARRIWAKALREKYGANSRAQKLKYHIQTSGRSLHAQEIGFNDIRTTLQALYAIYDNCNSLHTNAYDEAITTPTEESVRRAMAIQLIINRELGLAKNENPLQGAFIIEELTDLVEEAVMAEFDRITDRGGVLGAMETMYQRGKIQEESLYYETLKHTGEMPIIGVNTFLSSEGSPTIIPSEVIRATTEEKEAQINTKKQLQEVKAKAGTEALRKLQLAAIQNKNLFEGLMEAVKSCSLGQITNALYEVGGQYRRNM